jgi:hypothetical protein
MVSPRQCEEPGWRDGAYQETGQLRISKGHVLLPGSQRANLQQFETRLSAFATEVSLKRSLTS